MSVKCQMIMTALEKLAPLRLAEPWDNVGLLIGSPIQEVKNILVALDITEPVIDFANNHMCDMIVTHHPVIFKGITSIRTDKPQGQLLARLLKSNIAIYAAHTNLDVAAGGVNDVLACQLGLQNIKILNVSCTEKLVKLVVFVPDSHVDEVRAAITEAGAGHIGNYSHCSFQTHGVGAFLPLAGTKPFLGKQGQLEYAQEYRLETIMPEEFSRVVIKAMLQVHPYEEVAYDLYPVLNDGAAFGLGRIGQLAASAPLFDFATQVKQALGLNNVKIAGDRTQMIRKVAVCGGSGASLISKAISAGADVLVTGDVRYHEAQEALALGLAIIEAGHFASEQPVVPVVADYLRHCAHDNNWSIGVHAAMLENDVFTVL